ncbi:DMT family transporter [Granulosicoccus antarcticus]|uniref:Riboflavin transporter n=1 Tax=Granulosicoccus antarcticus IMCC3135 TaxID=1192854 RepID=A0A2Z2NV90_9GAMM|nr:DMT family transporter [Granulosicoccus antarcticus]ASJ71577.1 Riboflavin transporter [Granulosicoccus antarcticus IMCC3135]
MSTEATTSLHPIRQTNSQHGIQLMLAGMFLFATADVLAKFLTQSFHPIQIFWFRQLALLLGVLFMLGLHGPSILITRRRGLQITRGVLVVGSSLFFIFAVRHVALANAVAASFVAPFFLTILAALLLGEKVGIRRWLAVCVGFIGALVIVRPGTGAVHPAVLLVVVAAACYATRQVLGRLLADTDKTITTVSYTALTASCIASVALPFFWQSPETGLQWLALIAMGLFAGVGEVMVVKSLEVSEAAAVAPIHYSLIIWGTLYGYLVFDQLPDQWTWIGTAIIVSAGIYTLKRDQIKATAES